MLRKVFVCSCQQQINYHGNYKFGPTSLSFSIILFITLLAATEKLNPKTVGNIRIPKTVLLVTYWKSTLACQVLK